MPTKTIHNNDYYYDIVRKNIRKYRKQKNYTQQKLSEEAEISIDFLSEIESVRRKKSFSIATLGRIADVLEISICDFFKSDNE